MASTNGMVFDDLSDAPNGPALADLIGNQVDLFYGNHVANVAALPVTGSFAGQRVYVDDIDTVATWNDTEAMWDGYWKSYTPTVGNMPTSAIAVKWRRVGQTVSVNGLVTASGVATGVITVSTPTTSDSSQIRPAGTCLAIRSTTYTGGITVFATTTTVNFGYAGIGTFAAAVPGAWASGNTLGFDFSYTEAP